MEFGWQFFKLGRLDEAEDVWTEAATEYPDSAKTSAQLGLIAAARGDFVEARRVLGLLNERDDVDARIRLRWQASIAEAMGEFDEAVSYHRKIWEHPNMYGKGIGLSIYYYPSLRGYPPFEEIYWPEGREMH